MATTSVGSSYRFGPFALDLRSGELIRNGRRVRLQDKPCSILCALAEHPGEVVTRAELQRRLWPNDTYVDFEDGLNTAMRKLREALGDDPQSPRYIETVRGRGYRFLPEVVIIGEAEKSGAVFPAPAEIAAPAGGPEPAQTAVTGASLQPKTSRVLVWTLSAACLVAIAAGGLWYWLSHGHPVLSFSSHDPVLIADYDNQTGDARFDHALEEALTVSLQQSRYFNVYSRLQAANALRLMSRNQDARITPAIGREICLRESIPALVVPGITRSGDNYLLTAQLFDPSSGAVLRSWSEPAHGEEQILPALDAIAANIRRDLGESRLEIRENHRPLPQVTTASLQALQDYVSGADLFGHGQAAEAVLKYKAAIAADPDFAIAHAALGYAYSSFYLNQPALGRAEFARALALSARTTQREHAWIELRSAESDGRISEALDLYRAYLARWPGDWPAEYSYARLLRMNGHPAEALSTYQQMTKESPDEPGLYIEIATAYGQLRQFGPAIQAYEKAFSIDPQMKLAATMNHEYGETLIQDGQDEKAAQAFSALLADPRTWADGQRWLAFLDLYHGQYASARKRFTMALARASDPFSLARIRYMLAVVAAGQGNRTEAVAQLDRIMAADFPALGPKVIYGSLVGQAYARLGEAAKAKKVLIAIAPMVNERVNEEVAYSAILKAEVAAATGDFATALQFLKPPQPGDSSEAAVLACEALASINQRMGKTDDAVAWYKRFLANADSIGWEPQQREFEAYYSLALDYRSKGDRADALSAVATLSGLWKNADRNLPLLIKTRRLADQSGAQQ
jgi:DNA-binding winged helix-turn-helix (wHTH) protein/Tfp pilus assembly protein PilF